MTCHHFTVLFPLISLYFLLTWISPCVMLVSWVMAFLTVLGKQTFGVPHTLHLLGTGSSWQGFFAWACFSLLIGTHALGSLLLPSSALISTDLRLNQPFVSPATLPPSLHEPLSAVVERVEESDPLFAFSASAFLPGAADYWSCKRVCTSSTWADRAWTVPLSFVIAFSWAWTQHQRQWKGVLAFCPSLVNSVLVMPASNTAIFLSQQIASSPSPCAVSSLTVLSQIGQVHNSLLGLTWDWPASLFAALFVDLAVLAGVVGVSLVFVVSVTDTVSHACFFKCSKSTQEFTECLPCWRFLALPAWTW